MPTLCIIFLDIHEDHGGNTLISKDRNQTTCEDTTLNLECSNQQTINVKNALYGRDTDNMPCGGNIFTTNCPNPKSLSVVRSK